MNSAEFRVFGKQMVDYIADYLDTVKDRRVTPDVTPGFLSEKLPNSAPIKPESFEDVLEDCSKLILPGVAHWRHPSFHAFYPSGHSYPAVLADMLSDAIGAANFSWAANPAGTELEIVVVDWLGQMMGLPEFFLFKGKNSTGGGMIQNTASDCTLAAMLTAKFQTLKQFKGVPNMNEMQPTLVAYCSSQSHSSVEKAAKIAGVTLRVLETDKKLSLRGNTFNAAIKSDIEAGLYPFFVCATLGTTSTCAFDSLNELGPICAKESVWLHIDAAYAGAAFICPEFRYLMSGIEHANSFSMNPHKWMLVNLECAVMWVSDKSKLEETFTVDPLYLRHGQSAKTVDYRNWGIPLTRGFKSLKLWFVLRMYGVEGVQNFIRSHVKLGKLLETLITDDPRFEVVNEVIMGLICFRLKASDRVNKQLLDELNKSGKIHLITAGLKDKFTLRFCISQENMTDADIIYDWKLIQQTATHILTQSGELYQNGYQNGVAH